MEDAPTGSGSWKSLLKKAKIPIVALIALWMISTLLPGKLLQKGDDAPAWRLPVASANKGELLELTDLKGNVVVLDFWSTTCPPCLRQMDEIETVKRLMDPRGVKIVGIAVEERDMENLLWFIKNRNISYPIVMDNGDAANAYKVKSLPTVYVIDGSGRVVASHSGLWSSSDISRAVTEALASRD